MPTKGADSSPAIVLRKLSWGGGQQARPSPAKLAVASTAWPDTGDKAHAPNSDAAYGVHDQQEADAAPAQAKQRRPCPRGAGQASPYSVSTSRKAHSGRPASASATAAPNAGYAAGSYQVHPVSISDTVHSSSQQTTARNLQGGCQQDSGADVTVYAQGDCQGDLQPQDMCQPGHPCLQHHVSQHHHQQQLQQQQQTIQHTIQQNVTASMATSGQQEQPPQNAASIQAEVLRDVLCVMLGHKAAHVDHYRLTLQTVKDLCGEQAAQSAAAARLEAAAGTTRAVRQALQTAEKEWRVVADKGALQAKLQADAAMQALQSQLDQARKEASALAAEKRSLLGKAGQQGRDKREVMEALQASQARVGELEKQLASTKSALAAADKARTHAEAKILEAQKAAMAAQATCRDAEAAAAAAQQSAAQHAAAALESSKKTALQAQELVRQEYEGRLMRERAAMNALMQEALLAVGQLEQELAVQSVAAAEELQAAVADAAQVKEDMRAVFQQLRAAANSTHADIRAGVDAMCHVCDTAQGRFRTEVQSLLNMDAQLATLGPAGLDGLYNELQQARSTLEQTLERCSQLEVQLASSDNDKQSAAVKLQLQQAELSMLTRSQADLQRELTVVRADLARVTDQCNSWAKKHREALSLADSHTVGLAAAKSKLGEAEKKLAAMQQQVEEGHQKELELEECVRSQAEQQAATAMSVSCLASKQAAEQLRQLRLAYFTPVGQQNSGSSGAGPFSQQPSQSIEEVVGLGLCQLSHEQVMQALNSYMQRQKLVAAECLSAANTKPHVEGSGTSTSETPTLSGTLGTDLLSRELLWLEGCMLLLMVQLRQQECQVKEAVEHQEDECGAIEQAPVSWRATQRPGIAPSPCRSLHSTTGAQLLRASDRGAELASQMVKVLVQQQKKLQRQVATLSSQAHNATPPPPNSFLAYLPLRRPISFSSRPPAPASQLSPAPSIQLSSHNSLTASTTQLPSHDSLTADMSTQPQPASTPASGICSLLCVGQPTPATMLTAAKSCISQTQTCELRSPDPAGVGVMQQCLQGGAQRTTTASCTSAAAVEDSAGSHGGVLPSTCRLGETCSTVKHGLLQQLRQGTLPGLATFTQTTGHTHSSTGFQQQCSVSAVDASVVNGGHADSATSRACSPFTDASLHSVHTAVSVKASAPRSWSGGSAESPAFSLHGLTARQLLKSHSLTAPSFQTAANPGLQVQDTRADDDDVMQLIHMLDDSGLRSSRGLSGIAANSHGHAAGMSSVGLGGVLSSWMPPKGPSKHMSPLKHTSPISAGKAKSSGRASAQGNRQRAHAGQLQDASSPSGGRSSAPNLGYHPTEKALLRTNSQGHQ